MSELEKLEQNQEVYMDDSSGFHIYRKGDKAFPSVTTILNAVSYNKYIVKWANNLGFQHKRYEDELDRTAVEGTLMHAFAQYLVDPDHGEVPTIKDPLTDYYVRQRADGLRLKLKFHEGHWSTVFSEKLFISESYEIGGTLDWCANWYDKLTLFDFKSSSGLREKHLYQLGGYDLILQDNGIKVDQAGIILVKRDNCIINIFSREELDELAQRFLVIKDYYYKAKRATDMVANPSDIL